MTSLRHARVRMLGVAVVVLLALRLVILVRDRPLAHASPQQFISAMRPLADEAAARYGIPPAVTIAQAALESAWGDSPLALGNRNYYGMTAVGSANEWWSGATAGPYRAYRSPKRSVMDYARNYRTNPAYAAAVAQLPDVAAFIRAAGPIYAPYDPTYARDILAIIRQWGL